MLSDSAVRCRDFIYAQNILLVKIWLKGRESKQLDGTRRFLGGFNALDELMVVTGAHDQDISGRICFMYAFEAIHLTDGRYFVSGELCLFASVVVLGLRIKKFD